METTSALPCAQCGAPLPRDSWQGGAYEICPGCRAPVRVQVFPAMFERPEEPRSAPAREGEAVCFYHAAKQASAACDQCGRLLCPTCHVAFLGQTWCGGCIEARRKTGRLANLDTRRMRYDKIALELAVLPLLFWVATILTAPAALYVAIRYWRAPRSLVRHTRWALYAAIVVSIAEIGGWIWLLGFAASRIWRL